MDAESTCVSYWRFYTHAASIRPAAVVAVEVLCQKPLRGVTDDKYVCLQVNLQHHILVPGWCKAPFDTLI